MKNRASKLAVIIIGRNESLHIEKCIRSVLKATRKFNGADIVYVDSASTDDTVTIASGFPIRILQLKPDWPLSAAAGRYIGTLNTESEYLFFIDGDTLLFQKWILEGISFLESHPEAGGVAGLMHELFESPEGKILGLLKNRYQQKSDLDEVKTFGGIALYPRFIFEKVGPFNPYIPVDEERELAMRIRKAGYKLIRIPDPMAITYGQERETISEILRRGTTRLYNYGIPLKYCRAQGMGRQYLTERLTFVVEFLIAAPVALAVLVFLLWVKKIIFLAGFLVICMMIVLIIKRGDYKTIITSFLKRIIMSIQTILSYRKAEINAVENYPVHVKVIR